MGASVCAAVSVSVLAAEVGMVVAGGSMGAVGVAARCFEGPGG